MEKALNGKKKFIIQALQLAEENIQTMNGGPFGAVIVKSNQIVGSSGNNVLLKNDPTAHAEVEAIREACKNLNTFDLSGCEIYTSCEPCPMCLGAIMWARIDKIFYAADRHDAEKAGFDDLKFYSEIENDNSLLTKNQLLQEQAVEVFNKWLESENRPRY